MEQYFDPAENEQLVTEMRDELQKKLEYYGIDEDEVLRQGRQDIESWDSYFDNNITQGKDDLNFVVRDQWTPAERKEFTRLFKPAMTFNKLYDSVKKIVGEQRRNKPDLMVRNLAGKASEEDIDLRQNLVRTISYDSQNDLIYQAAFKSALLMGFGAFEVVLDYESPQSFNQVIRYDLIEDATRVSFDPKAMKPHKGDGDFCARQYVYSKQEFHAKFPHVEHPKSFNDQRTLLDFEWYTRDTVTVMKYCQKIWYPERILKLSNGMVVTEDEWEDMQKQIEAKKNLAQDAIVVQGMIMNEIPRVLAERKTQNYTIFQFMMTQNQIIDVVKWPSKYLPIIFVDGDSTYLEGQQYTKSFIHEARDAQKFVNYVGSEITAEIKNRRREQWLGTVDNIEGQEDIWRQPELQNGILLARPDSQTGQLPAKMPPSEVPASMLQQYMRGSQDIREILGTSEAQSLQGRDVSGVARRERKIESSGSSYVYFDNLNQAIEQSGRVVLDLLPEVYGKDERLVNLSKPDGSSETIVLNKRQDDKIKNQITEGNYDVEIDTGPSFAVQKEVALEFLQQTLQANPQVFPLIADLWAKQLDVQFQPQLVERLQSLVPPNIIAKEKGEPPPPPQPNPQMMMAQQKMQQDQAELQLKQEKLQLDKMELALKAQKDKLAGMLDVFNHNADIDRSVITHHMDKAKMLSDENIAYNKILADLHKDQKNELDPGQGSQDGSQLNQGGQPRQFDPNSYYQDYYS